MILFICEILLSSAEFKTPQTLTSFFTLKPQRNHSRLIFLLKKAENEFHIENMMISGGSQDVNMRNYHN